MTISGSVTSIDCVQMHNNYQYTNDKMRLSSSASRHVIQLRTTNFKFQLQLPTSLVFNTTILLHTKLNAVADRRAEFHCIALYTIPLSRKLEKLKENDRYTSRRGEEITLRDALRHETGTSEDSSYHNLGSWAFFSRASCSISSPQSATMRASCSASTGHT